MKINCPYSVQYISIIYVINPSCTLYSILIYCISIYVIYPSNRWKSVSWGSLPGTSSSSSSSFTQSCPCDVPRRVSGYFHIYIYCIHQRGGVGGEYGVPIRSHPTEHARLFEKFWRISLYVCMYVTDDAIAKLYVT